LSHADRPDPENIVLDNGQVASTASQVLEAIEALGIGHQTITHKPLYTVDEAQSVEYKEPGAHTKNLFLRNKKGRMFLVVIAHDRTVDLRALRDKLHLPGGHFAFGSTERMAKYLGVVPGAVTPLAVINDHGRKVQIIVDQSLLQEEWIYMHPCRNTHSTRVRTADLLKLLEAWNHPVTVVAFDD
jgi:Ala-tRNA(Pro) deacylase